MLRSIARFADDRSDSPLVRPIPEPYGIYTFDGGHQAYTSYKIYLSSVLNSSEILDQKYTSILY